MTQVQPTTHDSAKSEGAVLLQQPLAQSPIDQTLQKLSRMELSAKEHFEAVEHSRGGGPWEFVEGHGGEGGKYLLEPN